MREESNFATFASSDNVQPHVEEGASISNACTNSAHDDYGVKGDRTIGNTSAADATGISEVRKGDEIGTLDGT